MSQAFSIPVTIGLGRGAVLCAALLLLAPPAAAQTCTFDADCDDGVECNGLETCGYDRQCRAGFGLCGPATAFVGTAISASSRFGTGYVPANLIDGVDASSSSWCSAAGDPEPRVSIAWAVPIEVTEVRVLTSWSPSYDFLTARFRLLDAAGVPVFETPTPVAFTAGEIALPVAPAAAGVRALELIGETWRSSAPCLSEIEVDGTLPCAADADCAFSTPCVAVGVCAPSGSCAATASRCRNVGPTYASLSASSVYGPAYPVEQIADGIDDAAHSWCAANADAAPTVRLELSNDPSLHVVRLSGPWVSSRLDTARVVAEDAAGLPTYDSGEVALEAGALDLRIGAPGIPARAVELQGLTFDSGPCVGELELIGEFCAIAVIDDPAPAIVFQPGTPPPDFEVRYGTLSELREDGGFDRATCLGRTTGDTLAATLPDPAPGAGYYYLARGFDVCASEGFGLASFSPNPRDALAAAPSCEAPAP